MSNEKISSMSLKEKASMVVGYQTMSTLPIPEKGIKPIIMSDGPNGLRLEGDGGDSLSNISKTKPSTCFPVGVTLGSSWNVDLANKMGKALGEECVNFNINLLLGPAVNIQRNPLCGRNFEYLSEDPLLAGKMGANLVDGIQSQGVGACLKHFACNNNEKYRFIGDSIVDDRALHEIYLKPYEIIVKESNPRSIMLAYNQINGVFASENKYLIEDVLRDSWGFDGVTLTDWGAMVHREIALNNGCDLEMPGMCDYNIKLVYDGVNSGRIKEETLDKSIQRLIDLQKRTEIKEKKPCDFLEHYRLAMDIALEGAVLLKNEGNVLPLNKKEKVLVIGGLFSTMRYQGCGSSLLNPMILKDHKKAFEEYRIDYDFVLGYKENESEVNEDLEKEAVEKAKEYETILCYCGLNDYFESEGFDRDDMSLPQNQISLLDKLSKLGKKVVVVLFGGAPVELPFIDDVPVILDMMLPGEAGGEATTRLLFGEVSPSGKLSQTWPKEYSDVPFSNEFISSPYELYKESIFVGYRYYQTVNKEVRFPFGYGLSYSSFEYSDLSTKVEDNGVSIAFNVKNTGKVTAKEIAELYISKSDSKIVRPSLELKGFEKVELKPNEVKEVSIFVPFDLLKTYINKSFVLEGGDYQIKVGSSSDNILLSGSISVPGEKIKAAIYDEVYKVYLGGSKIKKEDFEKIIDRTIPNYEKGKRPYTLETPIGEFNSFFGKIFKNAVCGVGLKKYKKALKMPDGLEKEREKKAGLFVYKLMPNNSLRSLSFSASGSFDYPIAEGILELSNGHFIRGIKKITRKYKIKD